MCTLLSGATAALAVFFLKPCSCIMGKGNPVSKFNPSNIINGLLAGHVAITAPCNNVECYSAIIIGLGAGIWYILSCKLLIKLKIDDPVEAS